MQPSYKISALIFLSIALLGSSFSARSQEILECNSTTLCGDFNVSAVSPLITTFTAKPINGTAPYSFFWNFGDGLNDTGSSANHTYQSQNTYLVTLHINDSMGTNFIVSHNVTEMNPPTGSFPSPNSTSWNSNVSCPASLVTIPT